MKSFGTQIKKSKSDLIDHKARQRIEELYVITERIVREQNRLNRNYQKKIYRKYKKIKHINRSLKAQLINQHCAGCQCNQELNRKQNMTGVHSTCSLTSGRISVSIDTEKSPNDESHQLNRAQREFKTSLNYVQEDKKTHKSFKQSSTKNLSINQNIDETELPDEFKILIRQQIERDPINNQYLLKLTSYPIVCRYLCNSLADSFYSNLINQHLRPLIINEIPTKRSEYSKTFLRVRQQLRELHQTYLLQFIDNPDQEDTIAMRKRHYHRNRHAKNEIV